jgi:hypothetical protein
MRIFTGLLGVVFIVFAFVMDGWKWHFETALRPPTWWIRLFTLVVGLLEIYLSITWPFDS